jgi:hypothetical protein
VLAEMLFCCPVGGATGFAVSIFCHTFAGDKLTFQLKNTYAQLKAFRLKQLTDRFQDYQREARRSQRFH